MTHVARFSPLLVVVALLSAPTFSHGQPGTKAAPTSKASKNSGLVTVTLRDGQLLRGQLLAETASHLIIKLVSGGELVVKQVQVRSIKRDDPSVYVSASNEVFKHDPNRTRYLYGSSAFMLRQGEGYFSQTELIASTIGYGLTDWFTIQLGSIVPALFADDGANAIIGARVGTALSEHVHVAAGINSMVIPGEGSFGLISGSVTLGSPVSHVTFTAGRPFYHSGSDSDLGRAIFSVSGNLRMSKHFAFVTENWIVPTEWETDVISSFAGRFLGERSAIDVGLVFIEGAETPLPWLDFTWHWD